MFAFLRLRRQRKALVEAIYKCDLPRIQKLVEAGLDLKFAMDGYSPLTKAVWRIDEWTPNARKVVDYLLAHGASARDAGNESLLHGAAIAGDHELIDLALAAGHDIHQRLKRGHTPFQSAAFRNRTETIKYLIEKGAGKADFDLKGVRWYAIQAPTIQVLLEIGVDVPIDIAGYVREGKW